MKNKLIVLMVFLVLSGVGYYFYAKGNTSNNLIVNSESNNESAQPQRPSEINGTVVSILGNEIVVANEYDKVQLTDEEQAAKKAERQNMSPEERAALREEEKMTVPTEEVNLIIPVGVSVVKGTGDATGAIMEVDISEISEGSYVSIWTNTEGQVEYVKIKGI